MVDLRLPHVMRLTTYTKVCYEWPFSEETVQRLNSMHVQVASFYFFYFFEKKLFWPKFLHA